MTMHDKFLLLCDRCDITKVSAYFLTPLHSHNCSPMAENFQHTDTNSGIPCNCPHFVTRSNLTSAEVNTCDGCLHTVAWHWIPVRQPNSSASSTSTTSNSAALSVDEILASFTSQATSVSGEMKAQKRGKRKASEAEACQEAVSGLKCGVRKDTMEEFSTVRPFVHLYQDHIR